MFGFFIFKKKNTSCGLLSCKKKQNKSAIRISARKKRVVQVNRRSLEQTRQQKKKNRNGGDLKFGAQKGPSPSRNRCRKEKGVRPTYALKLVSLPPPSLITRTHTRRITGPKVFDRTCCVMCVVGGIAARPRKNMLHTASVSMLAPPAASRCGQWAPVQGLLEQTNRRPTSARGLGIYPPHCSLVNFSHCHIPNHDFIRNGHTPHPSSFFVSGEFVSTIRLLV